MMGVRAGGVRRVEKIEGRPAVRLRGWCWMGRQREGLVDEKDPSVPKLREMLYLKQIIRYVLTREAVACGFGQSMVQRGNPAAQNTQGVHERIQR